jgi:hypothetical protein
LWNEDGRPHCVSVSQLLLTLFGVPRNIHGTVELFAGHLDKDKHNIEISNLCWMTKGEIRRNAQGKKNYLTTQQDRL